MVEKKHVVALMKMCLQNQTNQVDIEGGIARRLYQVKRRCVEGGAAGR